MSNAIDDPFVPPATRLARATASALRGGDLHGALRHCEEALLLTREHAPSAASVHTMLGRVRLHRGELTEALLHLDQALEVHRNTPSPHLVAATQLARSEALLAQGNIDGALTAALESATLYAKTNEPIAEARAQCALP